MADCRPNISQLINSALKILQKFSGKTCENLDRRKGGPSGQTKVSKGRQVMIGRALGKAAEHNVPDAVLSGG